MLEDERDAGSGRSFSMTEELLQAAAQQVGRDVMENITASLWNQIRSRK